MIIRKRAHSGGRASCASRAGSPTGNASGAATSPAISAEIGGKIEIPVGERTFTLRGVADRIERLTDGGYIILDYKTGAVPTEKQVRTGLAPQLTLEAAMLRDGGFKDIAAGGSIAALAYVTLQRRAAARQNMYRSTSRTARRTPRPTTRWRG